MTTNPTIGLKRKRDPTFVASEKMALVELVGQHFAVVECKKTDATSIKQKTLEWQKIAEEFNAASPIHHRDWSVLKNCWENLKKRAKTEQTARNQSYLGTGGGPPRKQNSDPAIERVLELIQSRVSGYVNLYDCDGVKVLASGSNASVTQQATQDFLLFSNDAGTSETQVQDTNSETTEAPATAGTIATDWSQYTPRMLREPLSPALILSRSPSPQASESQIETPPQHQQASTTPTRIFKEVNAVACITYRDRLSSDAIPAAGQRSSTSRRRPTLSPNRETSNQATLNAQRISSLLKADAHAEEEHTLNMNILQEKYKQEKLKTAQEKLKTAQEETQLEILKFQLNKLQN